MSGYDFTAIESKWQRYWHENSTFRQPNPDDPYFKAESPKLYVLDMFPYPSGAGLHVGHPEGYTATDIVARYARMKGCNVLHPMGYDSFGLPAEQYAVEHGVHPRETTEQNIANIERQIKMFGFSYDWSRRVATTDVAYYRWTQWIFLQLYNSWYDPQAQAARPISELVDRLESGELVVNLAGDVEQPLPEQTFSAIAGMPDNEIKFAELSAAERRNIIDSHRLAYMDEVPVNWCPALGTVLANEEVTNDGRSERGNHPVYRRALKQWMLRITAYAERLLADIETVDWPEPIKIMQRNWIGKSTGANTFFRMAGVSPALFETLAAQDTGSRPTLTAKSFKGKDPYPMDMDRPADLMAHVRNLPHVTLPGATYFVTFSVADGRVLTEEQRGIVREACLHWHEDQCCVYALVVMDDHIHMIVQPFENIEISEILQSIKSFAAHEINRVAGKTGSLWQGETFDHIVRDDWWFTKFVYYICDNPVKKGLCNRWDEYTDLWVNEEEIRAIPELIPFGNSHGRDARDTQIEVFTTRPDTLFGATYMVLAPEHPLVDTITTGEQRAAVEAYVQQAQNKSELERTADSKEKTGVFTGAYAVNPVNNEKVPVWVADYVMMGYGTGAIMAVPAHDERDFDFAQAFDLPIRPIIKRKDEAAPRYVGGLSGENFAKLYETYQQDPEKYPQVRGLYFGGFWDVADDGTSTFQPDEVSRQWMKAHPETPKGFVVVGKDGMAGLLEAGGFESTSAPFPLCITSLDDDLEMVDSGILDGLEPDDAKQNITEWLEEQDLGRAAVNYKLRDWLFSRQRYWGEPFPIVHDVATGSIFPLAEDELPVTLPEMDDFSPESSTDPDQPPKPPLSRAPQWRLVAGVIMDDGSVRIEEDFPVRELFADPDTADEAIQMILDAGMERLDDVDAMLAARTVTVDGRERPVRLFTRELNTMPQWAGSCWYYLRYLDPNNNERFAGRDAERYWMGADDEKAGGVDLYVGGAEHAVLHLLYSRFWHKVLFDLGYVSTPEPFHTLFNQGMILSFAYKDSRGITIGPADLDIKDEGGEPVAYHKETGEKLQKVVAKMSKSLKNVVNPDEIISQYGADTFRMYEMFMGPLEASKPWNTNDVPGIFRFLQRVWRMILGDEDNGITPLLSEATDEHVEKMLHKLIKKVGEDVEAMKFNTAIAAMMEFVNAVFKAGTINKAQAERFLLVLAPFAPHIAEEIWQQLGRPDSLAWEAWPNYDESMIVENTVELPVQVNGKVRGRITVPADAEEAAILDAAKAEPNVAGSIDGKQIVKTIVVPGRLVNLVVK